MARQFVDLTGKQFGRLTVVKRETSLSGIRWLCKCSCGAASVVYGHCLKRGGTKSCGCYGKEVTSKRSTIHGHNSKTRSGTYHSWQGMLARCNQPKHKNYYGRGIVVCERWSSFPNFLEDMGERPQGTSLDRIDNNGNYEPTNCHWATPKEQARNRRKNHNLTFNGETKNLAEWAEVTGLEYDTLLRRLHRNLSIEKILSLSPLGKTKGFSVSRSQEGCR